MVVTAACAGSGDVMREHAVRRIPVVDEGQHAVGTSREGRREDELAGRI